MREPRRRQVPSGKFSNSIIKSLPQVSRSLLRFLLLRVSQLVNADDILQSLQNRLTHQSINEMLPATHASAFEAGIARVLVEGSFTAIASPLAVSAIATPADAATAFTTHRDSCQQVLRLHTMMRKSPRVAHEGNDLLMLLNTDQRLPFPSTDHHSKVSAQARIRWSLNHRGQRCCGPPLRLFRRGNPAIVELPRERVERFSVENPAHHLTDDGRLLLVRDPLLDLARVRIPHCPVPEGDLAVSLALLGIGSLCTSNPLDDQIRLVLRERGSDNGGESVTRLARVEQCTREAPQDAAFRAQVSKLGVLTHLASRP